MYGTKSHHLNYDKIKKELTSILISSRVPSRRLILASTVFPLGVELLLEGDSLPASDLVVSSGIVLGIVSDYSRAHRRAVAEQAVKFDSNFCNNKTQQKRIKRLPVDGTRK